MVDLNGGSIIVVRWIEEKRRNNSAMHSQILAGVVMTALFSFSKTTTAMVTHKEGRHRGLVYGGIAINAGSALGTIVAFLLVNVFQAFQEKPVCG